MTNERLEEIKAKHFGVPSEYRSDVVDDCIIEIERLIAEIERLQKRVAELEALLDRASDMLTDNVGACYCESPGHQPGCKLDEWCRDYAKLEARNDAPRPAKASDVTMAELEHISNCIHWIHVTEDNPNGSRCQECAIVYGKILRKREEARNDA